MAQLVGWHGRRKGLHLQPEVGVDGGRVLDAQIHPGRVPEQVVAAEVDQDSVAGEPRLEVRTDAVDHARAQVVNVGYDR